jgi:uncharacterized membrane protein YfcA
MAPFLALFLTALIGLVLGLFGSGGSIITVPVLVYLAGIPAHQAVAMSLAIVGGTSAMGGILNIRRGYFHPQTAVLFALSGFLGGFIGAKFTHLVSARVLLLLFGLLMIAVGAQFLRRLEVPPNARGYRPLACFWAGLAVGGLTGFLGVGGGFLIVPALVMFAQLEMKSAIGTGLAVIAANCLGGLLGQWPYVTISWQLTLAFLSVAAAGMLGGLALNERLASPWLQRVFAWSVIGLGLFLAVTHRS